MPRLDPHDVLGVPRGASQATIKAAWRRLAREHHPDTVGADAAAARTATRRMAEINRAYQEIRGAPGPGDGPPVRTRRGGPPPEPPSRPITGRLDTTPTYRRRNATTGPGAVPPGPPPPRSDRSAREPLRASDPNGPLLRRRQRGWRPPPPPDLDAANGTVIGFGKFHGHSLGEIAAFEPSYIDWLARTISHDPDLVAAARVVRDDLDARGVVRRSRPWPVA